MRRGGGGRRITRLALVCSAGVVLVLALMQMFLPAIVASRISSRVGRYGSVESVSVSALPALELLWGSADSVRVRAKSLAVSPEQAAKLLWEARGAASMDVSADSVQVGPLRLSDASLHKRGDALTAEADASEAAVMAALPPGFDVRLLRSEGGEVEVQASGGLFGIGATLDALALASEGRLIAHPLGLLVEGLVLTLFSDPHVYVQGVGASVHTQTPLSYRLSMRASLR